MCLTKQLEVFITKRNLTVILLAIAAVIQLFLGLNQWRTNINMEKAQLKYQSLTLNNKIVQEYSPFIDIESDVDSSTAAEESSSPFVISYRENPAAEFLKLNPDYAGHLIIPGTRIDYPVVKGMNNEFYLNHNFSKEKDQLGSIFMDYRNIGMHLDKHTILYGHYSDRGYMFGDLENYLDADFLQEHKIFQFATPQGVKSYEIFSVHISHKETPYIDTTFQEISYEQFLSNLKEISIMKSLVSPSASQRILTLSTCNYEIEDGRLFIHAVELP